MQIGIYGLGKMGANMARFDSQGKADSGNKMLAEMRQAFGGHAPGNSALGNQTLGNQTPGNQTPGNQKPGAPK